ncbi:hypothetical protein BZA77DRAFT_311138 [Pyronema omphalodes]|nr:hypothetical protein BZA77DRAFT_311138 [Pyronema omphalodes]
MRLLIFLPIFVAIIAGTAIPEQPPVSEALSQEADLVQPQGMPPPHCNERGTKCSHGIRCCIPRVCRFGYCV